MIMHEIKARAKERARFATGASVTPKGFACACFFVVALKVSASTCFGVSVSYAHGQRRMPPRSPPRLVFMSWVISP